MFKIAIVIFSGFAAGALVAAGVFAYITMIGVIPRIATRSHTESSTWLYESAVIYGGSLGSIMYIFDVGIKLGIIGSILYALGAGMFVGCLAVALAEVLKTFPILTMRLKIKWGIPLISLMLALGKACGSIYGLIFGG